MALETSEDGRRGADRRQRACGVAPGPARGAPSAGSGDQAQVGAISRLPGVGLEGAPPVVRPGRQPALRRLVHQRPQPVLEGHELGEVRRVGVRVSSGLVPGRRAASGTSLVPGAAAPPRRRPAPPGRAARPRAPDLPAQRDDVADQLRLVRRRALAHLRRPQVAVVDGDRHQARVDGQRVVDVELGRDDDAAGRAGVGHLVAQLLVGHDAGGAAQHDREHVLVGVALLARHPGRGGDDGVAPGHAEVLERDLRRQRLAHAAVDVVLLAQAHRREHRGDGAGGDDRPSTSGSGSTPGTATSVRSTSRPVSVT